MFQYVESQPIFHKAELQEPHLLCRVLTLNLEPFFGGTVWDVPDLL